MEQLVRTWVYGVLAAVCFIGLAMWLDRANRTAFYVETRAAIVGVTEVCHIETGRHAVIDLKYALKDFGPTSFDCDAAPAIARLHGRLERDINRRTYIEFVYRSPADFAEHSGMFSEFSYDHLAPRTRAVGDTVVIHAHTQEAWRWRQ
jgi:hypothetical protein